MTAPAPVREFDVSARSTETFGRVLCNARQHHWVVDGPAYNNCPGEELTPPELFLAAVASCGVELVTVIAKEQGRAIPQVRLRVHGTVDRGRQSRANVTVFNAVRLDFEVVGTDGATAAELVEGFKRR
ncbi:MAG TPA: OsmC family protein [Gemmatimonadaceae bacterium]|nr:OsmC family protein [Gemmatimonadaceae bacterium]